ncbi:uncharacterized protein LOC143144946 [Ptiloglossa arizonensis]|uniref:uncharacterized protein LOC143144946 n=1 Tax=Ptiloglossa arizonensis TaxID=3350558 RepID=UPI003F9F0FFD
MPGNQLNRDRRSARPTRRIALEEVYIADRSEDTRHRYHRDRRHLYVQLSSVVQRRANIHVRYARGRTTVTLAPRVGGSLLRGREDLYGGKNRRPDVTGRGRLRVQRSEWRFLEKIIRMDRETRRRGWIEDGSCVFFCRIKINIVQSVYKSERIDNCVS